MELDFPFLEAMPYIEPTPNPDVPKSDITGWEYYMVAILALLLVIAVVGVLVSVNRKRQRGTTWFPEGFIQTFKPKGKNASRNSGVSVRKGPDGEEMKKIHGSQVSEVLERKLFNYAQYTWGRSVKHGVETDGRTDVQMRGSTDGWTDGRTY